MHPRLSLLLAFCAALLFAGCGAHDDDHGDHGGHDGPAHGGHDHDDDDHDHGDHDGDHGHGDEGARHALGHREAGPHEIVVALLGEIEAGHEAVLDVEVTGAHEAVRAWIGGEAGAGAMKSRLEGKGGDYHGHVEVPDPLPAGSAIWIEVQAADGARHRTSFAIPR